MEVKITHELDGKTVKEYLNQNGFSRGFITRLKKLDDGITVNGEHATVRRVLRMGDMLRLLTDDRSEDENEFLMPVRMPLDILYEDDGMIAINKPSDMATHPSIGHFEDTLANGLAYYFASRSTPFVFRAVNRLDRDTSGVVLVAKNRLTAAKLGTLMKKGCIRKSYIAVLNGRLNPEAGTVSVPIRRREASVILREACSVNDVGAKAALTEYRTLAANEKASVVSAEPITGRTHQLRVHFAHMGAPIVGDAFYGSAESLPTDYEKMMTRQALHAARLEIIMDGKSVVIDAPLPCDMTRLCNEIQGE